MSQPATTEHLAPTQYVVPVQALQELPKLAKATTAPPVETAVKQPTNWASVGIVLLIWTVAITMAFDFLYGGADVRSMQAKAEQAAQQAEALQQQNAQLSQGYQTQAEAISNAAAALGCPTRGPVQ